MPTRRSSTWLDEQRKNYINPKAKQLQTNNLPTNDEENTNTTNKGKDLLLANKPRIVPWRKERMPQRIQRHSRITLHRSIHPKWEQDKTEKSSYGLDWLQKGIGYGFTKLDDTLSQNVQNITWSHKLHRKEKCKPGEGSWQQEEEAKLKLRSKEGFSKEMHSHPCYS